MKFNSSQSHDYIHSVKRLILTEIYTIHLKSQSLRSFI